MPSTPVRTVRVSDRLWREVTLAAVLTGESLSGIMTDALERFAAEQRPTMSWDAAAEIVLADVRRSYGPDDMTDEECLIHAWDTDPAMMDPECQPEFDAYRVIMTHDVPSIA